MNTGLFGLATAAAIVAMILALLRSKWRPALQSLFSKEQEATPTEVFVGFSEPELRGQLVSLIAQANVEAQLQWASFAATMAISVGLVAAVVAIPDKASVDGLVLRALLSAVGLIASVAGYGATDRIGAYQRHRWQLARRVEFLILGDSQRGMVALGAELADKGAFVVPVDRVEARKDEVCMSWVARQRGHRLLAVVGVAWIAFFLVLGAGFAIVAARAIVATWRAA